ncbi:TetR/AcrR family transcriptional regulator [Nocardia sp. NPDC052566]|uniref:TetR/AcrR family transcriptional regulator n=1 Tax=Nocardia sp. NPDC052566 TaxID=3364330 RepID=UPI0037CB28CD
MEEPPSRRAPVQRRSRARVEQILWAAQALLDEGGTAVVTTRAIADRAEIPVASVYQYFGNREAVLTELAARQVDRLDEEMARKLATVDATTLPAAVDQIVAMHGAHYRAHPEIVAIYYTNRAAGAPLDGREHRRRLAGMVHALLLDRNLLRPGTAPLITEVAVELGDRILELAYHHAPDGDPAVIAEARLAMTRYLQAYAP